MSLFVNLYSTNVQGQSIDAFISLPNTEELDDTVPNFALYHTTQFSSTRFVTFLP